MHRDRHSRKTYSGRLVPRYPIYPRMVRRGRPIITPNPVLRIVAVVLVTLMILIFGSVAGVSLAAYSSYAQIAASLTPRIDEMQDRQSFQTSRIYDRNGILLYEFFDAGKRTQVGLDEVSPLLITATIAIEDKTFFTNTGVDYEGIARALYQNVQAGEEASGASTITQQVIKNIILTEEERSYENRYQRKLTEVVLAQELSQRYHKDEILELYLNEIYYGNLAYGIQAASEAFFNTSASDLTLAQASLLAGLPQRPSLYDPINFLWQDEQGGFLPGVKLGRGWMEPDYRLPSDIPPPKWRQIAVLRQMVDEGYIDEREAREAIAEDLRFAPQEVPLNAPHFVFYVRKLLEEKYGKQLVSSGGLNIYTTLDLEMQRMVQQKAAEHINEMEERNIHNASVVVMQPQTGQILAMVGSVDFNAIKPTNTPDEEGNVLDGQVNVAIRERQPGSALKPFTYLTAMEQGMNPASVLWDVPTEFALGNGDWYAPENYNGNWNGPVRIRAALANSLNMPAIKALKFAGIENMLELLDRVGVKEGLKRGPEHYGLSLTLGGGEVTLLELTTAYNTLASGGVYVPPTSILKITDGNGRVLESNQTPAGEQVLDPGLVAIITDMMSDDKAREPIWGLNSDLKLSRPAAVKTGTTDDWRDAWTAGFTPYMTVGVWSGNNNNEPTEEVESIQGGGVIWHNVMEVLITWIDTRPHYRDLFSEPFADAGLSEEFAIPDDAKVLRKDICNLPGPFGNYNEELFTEQMLTSMTTDSTSAPEDVRVPCDGFKAVTVVSMGNGSYCVPLSLQSYSSWSLVTINVWDAPEPDPNERVTYQWSGGAAGVGGGVSFPYCVSRPIVPQQSAQTAIPQSTATPLPIPTPLSPDDILPPRPQTGDDSANEPQQPTPQPAQEQPAPTPMPVVPQPTKQPPPSDAVMDSPDLSEPVVLPTPMPAPEQPQPAEQPQPTEPPQPAEPQPEPPQPAEPPPEPPPDVDAPEELNEVLP